MYSLVEVKTIKKNVLKQLECGKSLNQLVNKNGIPDENTIYKWLNKDEQFRDKYARSREKQALYYTEKIDKTIQDFKLIPDPDRNKIDVLRIEVDYLKWTASKLLPKVYGSAQNVNNIQVNLTPVEGMQIYDGTVKTENSD